MNERRGFLGKLLTVMTCGALGVTTMRHPKKRYGPASVVTSKDFNAIFERLEELEARDRGPAMTWGE